jgi:hypothetical protein
MTLRCQISTTLFGDKGKVSQWKWVMGMDSRSGVVHFALMAKVFRLRPQEWQRCLVGGEILHFVQDVIKDLGALMLLFGFVQNDKTRRAGSKPAPTVFMIFGR